ncbi:hypothetical protein, conserved [Entamoeba dispar SAW760]|uniref:Uncharacterized protein n=1 Tax=Entamoeba dispar (strain ATCC PRA-260 / SAW760) TaxID=370354 RepID=B0EGI1_ENTDS|nr:uncharacterized protein EDI_018190 [Entamoeba dispar SAW760]EDR26360.1 hypothetical protein, conserved [Entamoeba dispar SAW760]|eukprot:EDR26360.1 hypothetical protein, conserved [Entamoeba dispar SAW760]
MNGQGSFKVIDPFQIILLENEPILDEIEEELTVEKGTIRYEEEERKVISKDGRIIKQCKNVLNQITQKYNYYIFKVKIKPQFNEELVNIHLSSLTRIVRIYKELKFKRLDLPIENEIYSYVVYVNPQTNKNGIELFIKKLIKVNVFNAYYDLVELPELFKSNFIEICNILKTNSLTSVPFKLDINSSPQIFGFEHCFKQLTQFIENIQKNQFTTLKIKFKNHLTSFHKAFYEEKFNTLITQANWDIIKLQYKILFKEVKPGLFDCFVKAPNNVIKIVISKITEFFNNIVLVTVINNVKKSDEKDLLLFSRTHDTPYNALYFISHGKVNQMIAAINLCKDFHSVNMMTYKEELTNFIFEKYITSLPQNEDFGFEELDIPELAKSPTDITNQTKNNPNLIDKKLNKTTNDFDNQMPNLINTNVHLKDNEQIDIKSPKQSIESQSKDYNFEPENNFKSQSQNEIINSPNESHSLSYQQDKIVYLEHNEESTESSYHEDNCLCQTTYDEQLDQENKQLKEPPLLPPKPKRLQKEEQLRQESIIVCNNLQEKEIQESFYVSEKTEKTINQIQVSQKFSCDETTQNISQQEQQPTVLSDPWIKDTPTYCNITLDSFKKQNETNQQNLCDQTPQQEDFEPYKECYVSQTPEEKYQEELIEGNQNNEPSSEQTNQSQVENKTDKINQEQITISVLGEDSKEIESDTTNRANDHQSYDHFTKQEREDDTPTIRQAPRRPTRSSKNRKPATKKLFNQLKEMKIEILKEEIKENEETNEIIEKQTTGVKEDEEIKETNSQVPNQNDIELIGEENQNNKEPSVVNQQDEYQHEEITTKTSDDQLTKDQIDKNHSNVNQMLLEDLQKTLHTPKKENKPSFTSTNCVNENTKNQPFLPIFEIKLKKTSPIKKYEPPIQEEETQLQKIMKKRKEESN